MSQLTGLKKFNLKSLLPPHSLRRIKNLAFLGAVDEVSFILCLYFQNIFIFAPRFMGISDSEYFRLQEVYGAASIVCVWPGGWLSDRVENGLLVRISLILSGIAGIMFSIFSSPVFSFFVSGNYFFFYAPLYVLWGVSTSGLLWASLWKLVARQASSKKLTGQANSVQGFFNGIFGLITLIFCSLAYYLVSQLVSPRWGFSALVFPLGISPLCLSFFLRRFIKPLSRGPIRLRYRLEISSFKHWFSNPRFFLNFVLFAITATALYSFKISFGVFNYYLSNNLFFPTMVVLLLGLLRTYFFRFFIAPFAGRFGARSGSATKFLSVFLFLAGLFTGLIVFLPYLFVSFERGFLLSFTQFEFYFRTFGSNPILFSIVSLFYLLLGIVTWSLVVIRWSPISELGTPDHLYGSTVGLASFFVLSANIWLFEIFHFIQSKNERLIVDSNGIIAIVVTFRGTVLIALVLITIAFVGATASFVLSLIKRKGLTLHLKKMSVNFTKVVLE